MNLNLDIYVEGQRLDLFKDENVNIKASLKDSMSPDKIFTSVSASYVVPASKTNNKIFKHYYRTDIGNTVDARSFLDCELKLGGVLYRQGNLTLEKVKMKNGEAESYSVRFYGNLTELTKRIGEDELIDLNFSADDIDSPDWYTEMRRSMSTEPAIAFPLVSNKSRLIYDNVDKGAAVTIGENYTNVAYVNSTPSNQYGINTDELVGAYRCANILDAIENKYGVTIEGALRAPYVSNYRLFLDGAQKEQVSLTPFENYTPSTFRRSQDNLLLFTTYSDGFVGTTDIIKRSNKITTIFISVTSSSLSEYKVHLLRDGVRIPNVTVSDESGLNNYLQYKFEGDDGPFQYTFELESTGSGSVTVNYYFKHFYMLRSPNISFHTDYSTADNVDVTVVGGSGGGVYRVSDNLPKMKVKDFLTTLFKQFNIVTIVDGLEIRTFHYDYFMAIGQTIDITKYVDTSSSTISPPNYYSGLSFKNEDPVTLLEESYFSANRANYGSLEYIIKEDDSKVVGTVYEVKTPTQRVPTERLINLDDSLKSDAMTLQLTDANGDYVQTKPVFAYASTNFANYSSQYLALNDGSGTVRSLSKHSAVTNVYYQFQSLSQRTGVCGNFWGSELDEYYTDSRFSGLGYFNCFWYNYVTQAFDYTTRSIELTAELPMQTMLSMQLNTKLIIGGETFLIESMNTNFTTGKTKFKLSSINADLLDNLEASTVTVTQEDQSASSVRIVYLSSTTGRLEVSENYTVNAIGNIKNIMEY